MRAFHLSWFSFFLCFIGWFGIAPLMAIVREDLQLTQEQIGNTIIASVAITILARLLCGWLCDKYGPRITYTGLLIFGAFPVMLIGFADSYEAFLLSRLGIGAIGAAFVITQYHTSVMFSSNIVGTANATTAGWGNLGGGVTQILMPLIFGLFLAVGLTETLSWRVAMVVPGAAMIIIGVLYYKFTQDYPEGNLSELKKLDPRFQKRSDDSSKSFMSALKDRRVLALTLIYGACFGVELTINNIAALYFIDYFGMNLTTAGLIAASFGLMNIFARPLGGILGDKCGVKFGLNGRVYFLATVLFIEGLTLMLFSQMSWLPLAIATLVLFSLFVQMAEGATYCVVPFINRKALGPVSGIVGAGGNMGAVAAGFLFRNMDYQDALLYLGVMVTIISFSALLVKFTKAEFKQEDDDQKFREQEEEKSRIAMPEMA